VVTRVKGDPDHPANFGDVCAKAVHLPPTLRTPDRLLHPEIRSRRDRERRMVPWELALRFTAERLSEIVAAHGPDAVAVYASGQLTTEEYYVAGKLTRGFIGTNNFDTNSRLCMASAAAGYTRSLGADGPPTAYADIDEADCFFLIGTNTADCHPITFKRIRRRKLRTRTVSRVIVADPRWTETADLADLHLPPAPRIRRRAAERHAARAVEGRQSSTAPSSIGATTGWADLTRVLDHCPPQRAAENHRALGRDHRRCSPALRPSWGRAHRCGPWA